MQIGMAFMIESVSCIRSVRVGGIWEHNVAAKRGARETEVCESETRFLVK